MELWRECHLYLVNRQKSDNDVQMFELNHAHTCCWLASDLLNIYEVATDA